MNLHGRKTAVLNLLSITKRYSQMAAERSAPWLRAVIGIILAIVAFGGLLIAPWQEWTTTVFETTPVKSILGVIKWGGKVKPITTEGFVLPPYIPTSVAGMMGFLFGSASVNVIGKIVKRA